MAFAHLPELIVVAAALLKEGRVLLTERPMGKHMAGYWEFPGGKVEEGESFQSALSREIQEEIGVEIGQASPLITIKHDYPDRRVVLHVFTVNAWRGEVTAKEDQKYAWVFFDQFTTYPILPADKPVLTALRLPDSYLITPDLTDQSEEMFIACLDQALSSGVKIVQLRVPSMGGESFKKLAFRVKQYCHERDVKVLLNAHPELALDWQMDGVHLKSDQLMRINQRVGEEAEHTNFIWSASCHNLEQLQHAEKLGLHCVVLSPVHDTPSHKNVIPLGLERFADWVRQVNIPVYALGGMQPKDIDAVKVAGGQGIAAIRAFWPEPR